MYTLKLGNKTVSINHQDRHYIIGFKSIFMARKVHYNMSPEPVFLLLSNKTIKIPKEQGFLDVLTIDYNATLSISKCKGTIWEPMNDIGYHLEEHERDAFLSFPIKKQLGIIMPYELIEETPEKFMFKSYVIDPIT